MKKTYLELLPEEKWKYRRALRQMQILIHDVQTREDVEMPEFSLNPREIKDLLKIRHEMMVVNKVKAKNKKAKV